MKRNPEDEKLKEIVEKILNEEIECRNNPMMLTIRVLQEIAREHKTIFFFPYNLIPFFPSFESVARCKREIMNHQGKFYDDYGMEGITFEHPKKKEEEKFYCPDCKSEVKFGDKTCKKCGKQQLWALFG